MNGTHRATSGPNPPAGHEEAAVKHLRALGDRKVERLRVERRYHLAGVRELRENLEKVEAEQATPEDRRKGLWLV